MAAVAAVQPDAGAAMKVVGYLCGLAVVVMLIIVMACSWGHQ